MDVVHGEAIERWLGIGSKAAGEKLKHIAQDDSCITDPWSSTTKLSIDTIHLYLVTSS